MRSARHEFLSTGLVLSLPVFLAVFFPYEALRFSARPLPAERPAFASFVTLSSSAERSARLAARSAWQTSRATARDLLNVQFPLGELPGDEAESFLRAGVAAAPRFPVPPTVAYGRVPWSPSLRAGPPGRLAAGKEAAPAPAFSRDDMLGFQRKE